MAEKRVIPLLLLPCQVPDELSRLHYHNLSTEQDYTLGLMSLVRDLNQLESGSSAPVAPPETSSGSRNISIGGNANNSQIVVGDGNNVTQTN